MWLFLGWLVIVKYAGWIVFAFVVGWIIRSAVPAIVRWQVDAKYRRELFDAALSRRADEENREWLRGGVFEGGYPGATMPLTTEVPSYYGGNQREWYDYRYRDYDDGLTDWK